MAECLAESGAEILLVLNGSPFEARQAGRAPRSSPSRASTETGLPLVYVNQVGGQDELVFDGGSFVAQRRRRARRRSCRSFEEARRADALARATATAGAASSAPTSRRAAPARGDLSRHGARPARLREQEPLPRRRARPVGRHRFGASAAVAVDALGPERVRGVMMPSRYTTQRQPGRRRRLRRRCSASASTTIADRAGRSRPSATMLAPIFAGRAPDITEENIQSRIRGVHPDGALQQVRPDGADHRQQVRDVGRLRHALRRHVRRLLGAEGRLQDRRSSRSARWRNANAPDGALGPTGA